MKMNYFIGIGMHQVIECVFLLDFMIVVISWTTLQVN